MPRTMLLACFTLFFRTRSDAGVRASIGYNDVNTRLDGRACGMKSALRPGRSIFAWVAATQQSLVSAAYRLRLVRLLPDPEFPL
ncbi:hypothetical protein AXG89_01670 [Burkholderia sp. PAMC 26561]|nr:hypothetical protein AXG89_01670 [Burkholderia sp. PAMC 26561]